MSQEMFLPVAHRGYDGLFLLPDLIRLECITRAIDVQC